MGTLFDQRPRNYSEIDLSDVDAYVKELSAIAKKNKVTLPEVIETWKVLEMRRQTDRYVANGDIFDEQMGGFGKLIQELIEKIGEIAEILQEKLPDPSDE
jgi:hypothetical protein